MSLLDLLVAGYIRETFDDRFILELEQIIGQKCSDQRVRLSDRNRTGSIIKWIGWINKDFYVAVELDHIFDDDENALDIQHIAINNKAVIIKQSDIIQYIGSTFPKYTRFINNAKTDDDDDDDEYDDNNNIDTDENETKHDIEYLIGSRVNTLIHGSGIIKFKTPLNYKTEFYGIELDDWSPNGTDGRQLFQCKPGHGIFVKKKDIIDNNAIIPYLNIGPPIKGDRVQLINGVVGVVKYIYIDTLDENAINNDIYIGIECETDILYGHSGTIKQTGYNFSCNVHRGVFVKISDIMLYETSNYYDSVDIQRRNSLAELSRQMFAKLLLGEMEMFDDPVSELVYRLDLVSSLKEDIKELEQSKQDLLLSTNAEIDRLRNHIVNLSKRLQKYEAI